MRYELIITNQQPTCGGKAGSRSEIVYVETDDPVAYVREQAKDAELNVTKPAPGVVHVEFTTGSGEWARYEFTEDD